MTVFPATLAFRSVKQGHQSSFMAPVLSASVTPHLTQRNTIRRLPGIIPAPADRSTKPASSGCGKWTGQRQATDQGHGQYAARGLEEGLEWVRALAFAENSR